MTAPRQPRDSSALADFVNDGAAEIAGQITMLRRARAEAQEKARIAAEALIREEARLKEEERIREEQRLREALRTQAPPQLQLTHTERPMIGAEDVEMARAEQEDVYPAIDLAELTRLVTDLAASVQDLRQDLRRGMNLIGQVLMADRAKGLGTRDVWEIDGRLSALEHQLRRYAHFADRTSDGLIKGDQG